MLEYREFPLKTMFIYVLVAVPMAFSIYVIMGLLSGNLFDYIGTFSLADHHRLLGFGALTAVFALPFSGLLVDRIRKHDLLMYIAALIPSLVGVLSVLEIVPGYDAMYPTLLATTAFACLALMLISWSARINQSVVLRFRGRTVAIFLSVAVIVFSVYNYSPWGMIIAAVVTNTIVFPAMVSIVAVLISAAFRPWRVARASLTIAGSSFKYFIPMTFILGAHLLWYTVTKMALIDAYPSFISLSHSADLGFLEMVPFVAAILLAGFMSDRLGRKTAFRFVILMIGLLTIFGSTFTEAGLLRELIISERVVEGYLLGLCLLLIWPELGSVKTKGFRLSLYWFFFLGYMTLFWGLELNVQILGITFDAPDLLNFFGGQLAILLSLGALYLTGPLPSTLGREIEMEDLDLDFDERQVKRTVDAFVGAEDFASIRSQLDLIDASNDVSDSELDDILGDEFKEMLPLRRVPGIGASLEKKLIAAGYESAAQLAGESAQRLAPKIEGLSVAGAEKILKAARAVVKKTVKKKKK